MTMHQPARLRPPSEDFLHDLAEDLALSTLEELTAWVAANTDTAAAAVDSTLATIGIPLPDEDEDGNPIPGSVLRKILYWSHVSQVYAALGSGDPHPAVT